ncbi:hypothetical protein NDU88_004670 [Pleurodeles waltl]|uniref:Uncharacterized protein n=1 Tax=Pleurodeles waltl TaxID=8319 RepID=A0AAV7NLP9_PLEWA|nr:hypothetical protein NDU88_004670 [Pleurodeles waltl]
MKSNPSALPGPRWQSQRIRAPREEQMENNPVVRKRAEGEETKAGRSRDDPGIRRLLETDGLQPGGIGSSDSGAGGALQSSVAKPVLSGRENAGGWR